MDKANVIKTQEMWKDYLNTEFWLKTISEPAKHMIIRDNEIVSVDSEYAASVESLSYILSGNLGRVTLLTSQEAYVTECHAPELQGELLQMLAKAQTKEAQLLVELDAERARSKALKNRTLWQRIRNGILSRKHRTSVMN